MKTINTSFTLIHHIYTHIHIYTGRYIHTSIYMHTYMCINICVCIYILQFVLTMVSCILIASGLELLLHHSEESLSFKFSNLQPLKHKILIWHKDRIQGSAISESDG